MHHSNTNFFFLGSILFADMRLEASKCFGLQPERQPERTMLESSACQLFILTKAVTNRLIVTL